MSRIDEIEARLAKASPGPWMPCLGSGNCEMTALHFEGTSEQPVPLMVCDLVPDWMLDERYAPSLAFKPANMNLLENLHSDLRFLLDENRRMREALVKCRHELAWMLKAYPERRGGEYEAALLAADAALAPKETP